MIVTPEKLTSAAGLAAAGAAFAALGYSLRGREHAVSSQPHIETERELRFGQAIRRGPGRLATPTHVEAAVT